LTATFLPWWGPTSRREWDAAGAVPQPRPSEVLGKPKAGKVNRSLHHERPELVEVRLRDGSVPRRQGTRQTSNRPVAWTTIGEERLLWCRGSTWERILSGAVSMGAKGSMMASHPSNQAKGNTDRTDIVEAVTLGRKKT